MKQTKEDRDNPTIQRNEEEASTSLQTIDQNKRGSIYSQEAVPDSSQQNLRRRSEVLERDIQTEISLKKDHSIAN